MEMDSTLKEFTWADFFNLYCCVLERSLTIFIILTYIPERKTLNYLPNQSLAKDDAIKKETCLG